MNKNLQELLTICGVETRVDKITIKDLRLDSRKVKAGDVFLAVQGQLGHGINYLSQAITQGAVAILTDKELTEKEKNDHQSAPIFYVDKLSVMLGDLAHQFYGEPSEKLKVLAITGTNGKTSVAWFLMHALNQVGKKSAYIGTLGAGFVNGIEPLINTTPSVVDLHKLLAEFVEQGATHTCIEVSSHALDQGRIDGVFVNQALFTNLSRDHLDYHHNMENYADAKFKLFDLFCSQQAILNADDACAKEWLAQSINSAEVITYAIDSKADWQATDVKSGYKGLSFDVNNAGESVQVDSSLMGLFNVENLLLVAASLSASGVDLNTVPSLLQNLEAVPGRMNLVSSENTGSQNVQHATWVVDYAHTPDALSSVLESLKCHVSGKLYCIFGCGGDRDKGKRALMGQAAEKDADVVVVTDDNPRFESPQEIVAGILAGMNHKHEVIHMRQQAIKHVMHMSKSGDVVLVAGKGHEDYQEIKGNRTHYNDAETIIDLLEVAA